MLLLGEMLCANWMFGILKLQENVKMCCSEKQDIKAQGKENSILLSQSANTIKIKLQGKANGLFLSTMKLSNVFNVCNTYTQIQ